MFIKRILLVAVLAILIPAVASALSGSISSPQLGFPEDVSQQTSSSVISFLSKDLSFVKGNFVNEYTSQYFTGTAAKLNDLIKLLQGSGLAMKITFAEFKEDDIAFLLFQNAKHPEDITVTINTRKEDFSLSDLVFRIPAGPIEAVQSTSASAP